MSQIQIGADFNGIEVLKDACCQYAIDNGFETRTLRSSLGRYEIACKAKGCPWYLRATMVKKTSIFHIRSLKNKHSCFSLHHDGNKAATVTFLSQYLIERLKDQPDYRPVDIVSDVKRDLGVKIAYSKAYRAKEEALIKINGTHKASYQLLPEYCQGIEENNLGVMC